MTKISTLIVAVLCLLTFSKINAQNNPILNTNNEVDLHDMQRVEEKKARKVLTKLTPYDQIVLQTTFFKGDTLDGYDYTRVLNTVLSKYELLIELKSYMFRSEWAFVKQKYHLANLPFEQVAEKTVNPPPSVNASACNNSDFENNNKTNWSLYHGDINYVNLPCYTCATTAGSTSKVVNSGSTVGTQCSGGIDSYGNFSVVGSGSYSLLLNDDNAGGKIERASYSFVASGTNSLFTFQYAPVLQSGGHPLNEQPFFHVDVYDANTGTTVPCTAYDISVPTSGSIAGWSTSSIDNTVFYKGWTTALIDLQSVSGHTVTVNLTVSDCNQGAHFGYCYLDASCSTPQVTIANPSPCVGSTDVLSVPFMTGATYVWAGPGITASSANTATVNATGTYTATVSLGACSFKLTNTVTFVANPTVTATPSFTTCLNSPVTFSASGASTYAWSPTTGMTGSTTATPVVTPTSTSTVVYTVTGTTSGCSSSKTVTLTVNPKPTVTVNSPTVCTGSSVNLTAAGASTYTWNTGSTANPLSVTPGATSYTVTGTSALGCTNTAVSTVTLVTLPTVTVNSPTVCSGSSVNLTAAGASTYSWNTGSTANPLSVTPGATSYTVTGTTAAGCTNTAVSTVTVVALPTVTVNSPTVCSGSSINLTAAGASTYSWNTGSTANPLSVTPGATSYTVTGTSAVGCTNTAVSTVTVVAKPTVTVNSPTVCTGSSINLTAAGASTYSWNTGSTANPLSVTPGATSYTVTGTSAVGCTNTAVSTLTVVAKPTVTVNSPTVCSGSSVNLTAAGASTYSWNTGSTANPLSVTPGATSYTVTGTSAVGCTNTAVSTVTVVALPTVTVNSPTVCSGSSINLTAAGASTYSWNTGSTANPLSVTPGATSYTVTGTAATSCTNSAVSTVTVIAKPTVTVNSPTVCTGSSVNLTAAGASTYSWNTGSTANPLSVTPGATSYTVTGTSAVGCTNTAVSTVTVVAKPTLTLTPSPATICAGASSTLTANGGNTYTWTAPAGGGLSATTGVSVTATPTVPSGTLTYTLTGTAASSCTNTATGSLVVNPLPSYTLTGNAYTMCNGGSTTFTVNAGTGATYTWTPSATLTNPNTANPTASPTTSTIYSVVATNTLGCTNGVAATVTLNVNPAPTLTLTANSFTVCNGTPQTFTVAGASSYTWTPAATLTGPFTANPIANASTTTIYTVGGTASGCAPSPPLTLTLTVNPLPTYSLAANSYTICNGASQTFSVSGTSSSYTWTPATTLSGTNTASPTANPTTTTVYSVIGTNSLSCVNPTAATVTLTVNQLPTLTVTPAPTGTVCSASDATLTASGASTYTWSSGPTTSTVSLSGVNSGTTTVTNTISVVGTDAVNCTNSTTYTLTVSPTPTITLTSSTYTICSGSSTSFSVNTAAGSYSWAAPSGGNITGGGATATPTVTATNAATVAATQVYTVTATLGACTSVAQTVTLTVNPLPIIAIVPTSTAICSDGGSSTLTATGGNTYTWTPAGTLSAPTGSVVTAIPTDTTTPTVYTVTGTDANACVNTNTVSIAVNQTPTVTVLGGGGNSQVICGGGIVNTSVTGITFSVTPSGSITWTNDNANIGLATSGNGNIATYPAPTVTAPTIGVITANALAASGCASTSNTQLIYTVTINPIPSVITPTINPAGCGLSDGTIIGASGTGASGNYSYSWNGGPFVADSSLMDSAGTYPLQVKDNVTGCISSQNFTIPNAGAPAPPIVTPSTTVACVGDVVVLSAPHVNGTTYNWTEANGTAGSGDTYTVTAVPASPNPYTIGVTATANNCKGAANTTSITVNQLPTPAISNSTSQICNLTSTTLTVTPNAGGYSYQWGNSSGVIAGAIGDTLTVSAAGVYSVTVTNTVTGCQATTSANGTIMVNSLPVIDTTNVGITQSNCSTPTGGITNVTYTVNGTGVYVWTDNATGNVVGTNSPILSNVPAGNYCVQVTDANTCVKKFCSIAVTNAGAPSQPVLTLAGNDTTYCQGDALQTLTVTVNSGTLTPTVNWYSDAALTNVIAANSSTYTPAGIPIGTPTTVYVAATSNGCISTGRPITITINPAPIAPVITNTTTSYTYCQNQSPAPVSVNTGTTIPVWYSNSGGTTHYYSTSNPLTPPVIIGTTIYTVVDSISSTGCKNTSVASSTSTISVTFNPTPNAPTISTTSYTYCQGDVIQPISATTNPVGDNVVWYSGSTFVSNQNPFTPNVSATAGTYNYVAYDSSAAGCLSAASAQTVTVTVNATPTAPVITSNPVNPTYCQGVSYNPITATGNGGNIAWYVNGVYVTNTSSSPASYTPPAITPPGVYVIGLKDSTNSGCVNAGASTTLTLTINATPTVNIGNVSLDSAKCGLSTGGVNGITIVGGTPNYSYQWYDANGAVAGATSVTLSNVSTGNYTLQVTDANGCMANGAGGVTTFSVPASTAVHAQFSTNPSPATGTLPLAITFSNTSSGASNYIWSFGDAANTMATGTNANFTYTSIGTYTATLVAINGTCADTAHIVIVAEVPTTISVPNIFSPNGDGVNDEFFIINTGMRSMNCDIFNRWGQLLWTLTAPNQSWDGKLINGDKAPEGTYMYILQAQGLDGKTYNQQGTVTLVR
jgi:gliding motility-associated-like protein